MPQPGYPLPDGELGEDEIVCQLVYLPDRPEYWQAFLGALSYMATWRAWERDDDKRGKDAAANWRAAFELTMRCWRMACLDDLKDNVASILALMQNQICCDDDNISYYDSDEFDTDIVPGDGDDPDFYGETAVSDWDEWREYLCHNANLWVDELIRASSTLDSALTTGGLTISILAAIMTAIAFFVVGGVLALPIVMTILFGLTTRGTALIFSTSATDLENARNDILCAIISGRDVGSVIESAISLLAWETLYEHIDYSSAMAILYNGGDGDSEYLEAATDDSCTCDCEHVVLNFQTYNHVIYQSSAGSRLELERHTWDVYDNTVIATCWFNRVDPSPYCGPMKVIDTISVDDSLKFARITTYDQDNNIIDDWEDGTNNCVQDISLLVGKTCARFFLVRFAPMYSGCGTARAFVDMTYHDDV